MLPIHAHRVHARGKAADWRAALRFIMGLGAIERVTARSLHGPVTLRKRECSLLAAAVFRQLRETRNVLGFVAQLAHGLNWRCRRANLILPLSETCMVPFMLTARCRHPWPFFFFF